MTAGLCIETLEEALARHDKTAVLLRETIAIGMDDEGRWRDDVFVERLRRSVKCEEVYLDAYASAPEARAGIRRYPAFHSAVRP